MLGFESKISLVICVLDQNEFAEADTRPVDRFYL
jgi:hypothetical protein